MEYNKLIITAASQLFAPALLVLLGSLNCNWKDHPPVWIYDIGLDAEFRKHLVDNSITVIQVPPFCDHWRKHFTWKIWCWNHAGARNILWLDAGVVVMKPLDELFTAIDQMGYFAIPNYQLLDYEASPEACLGCGLDPSFRIGKSTIAANVIGFKKDDISMKILKEAFDVAMIEKNMAATESTHRHDQALISLLLHKHYKNIILSDGQTYGGWKSPLQIRGQKIWVHRRAILEKDKKYFERYAFSNGPPYFPADPKMQGLKGLIRKAARYSKGKILRWYLNGRQYLVTRKPYMAPYDGIKE